MLCGTTAGEKHLSTHSIIHPFLVVDEVIHKQSICHAERGKINFVVRLKVGFPTASSIEHLLC